MLHALGAVLARRGAMFHALGAVLARRGAMFQTLGARARTTWSNAPRPRSSARTTWSNVPRPRSACSHGAERCSIASERVRARCGASHAGTASFIYDGEMSFFLVRVFLYALAALAAGTAAAKFAWWHEHLGRAWALFSLEFLLLLVNYVLRRAAPDAALGLNATLIAANLAQIAAYWLMARVLSAAGIGYLMSPAKRILLTAAALAVAIA